MTINIENRKPLTAHAIFEDQDSDRSRNKIQ